MADADLAPVCGEGAPQGNGHHIGSSGEDCDDADDTSNPGASEVHGNAVDENCNTWLSCYVDGDADGFGHLTVTDGDGTIPDGATGDDLGSGVADDATDCNDGASGSYPGAPEFDGNDVDENCDGYLSCYVDGDGDVYGHSITDGDGKVTVDGTCDDAAAGVADDNTDCADGTPSTNPGVSETHGNGADENCNGYLSCYVDGDGDGYGHATATDGDGTVLAAASCNNAGALVANGQPRLRRRSQRHLPRCAGGPRQRGGRELQRLPVLLRRR